VNKKEKDENTESHKKNAKRYFADIIMNFTNHCSKARDYEAQNIEMLICGSFGSFIVIFGCSLCGVIAARWSIGRVRQR
jgi:flavorubredoxin